MEPMKLNENSPLLASRAAHPENTVVQVGECKIGGGNLAMIAGPCAVESEEQIFAVAEAVKASGANILRGGAFKPRTSPYKFQGLGADGIRLLAEAGKAVGLPVVSEITSIRHLSLYEDMDMIQVGARNMQNFDLLKELGHSKKPVLLKRGFSNTVEEFLMSAEYILAGGNENVVLCERGMRTFETATRNTLDLSAVPVLHRLSHLPVLVDPSHAAGKSCYVAPLARAAAAIGADGLLIEVHNAPEQALSDGPQALRPAEFSAVAKEVKAIHNLLCELNIGTIFPDEFCGSGHCRHSQ